MWTKGILGRIFRHLSPLGNMISDQSGDVKAIMFLCEAVPRGQGLGSNAQPQAYSRSRDIAK